MTLRITDELSGGYGTAIAYSTQENLWVTVGPAQFHVWRDRELLYSTPLGGHYGGNPSFSTDGRELYIGARIFDLTERRFLDLPSLNPALVDGLPPESNARPELFEINGSAWSPDGEQLVIHTQHRSSRDPRETDQYRGPWKRLLLLRGRTRERLATLLETSTSSEYTAIAVNQRLIAAAALSVMVWNRSDRERVAELEGFNVAFRDLRFSADGSLLAAPAWDGQISLWQTQSWRRAAAWKAHGGFARCVAFHPSLPVLASGGGDTKLNLWQTSPAGQLADSLDVQSRVAGLAFHAGGESLTAALEDGRLVVCSYQP